MANLRECGHCTGTMLTDGFGDTRCVNCGRDGLPRPQPVARAGNADLVRRYYREAKT